MNTAKNCIFAGIACAVSLVSILSAADNPFVGRWALTIPGGGAGWLGVEEKGGMLSGSVLWGGGSVVPVASTKVVGDKLIVTREFHDSQR